MNDGGIECSAHERIRVAVADPRPLMAQALVTVVTSHEDFTVISRSDGATTPPLIAAERPDAVLLGVGARIGEAVALASSLRARLPFAGIVMIADVLDADLVRWAIDGSLTGLLLVDAEPDEIVSCLRHVVHGRTVLPSGWQAVGRGSTAADPLHSLSERQLEVLRLLADGLAYDEIAAQLFISVNTVKFHLRVIFERLGVHNRMAAARVLAESPRMSQPAGGASTT